MKKCISLLLALLLLFALMLPAGAMTILPPVFPLADEKGYTFTVTETQDGKILSDVRYVGFSPFFIAEDPDLSVTTVPATLGGVLLTPENLTGEAFYESMAVVKPFSVEEANHAFCVADGCLLSADGKTLVYFPDSRLSGLCRIPSGTETLGSCCMNITMVEADSRAGLCVVVPASVTAIADNAFGNDKPIIAGEAGTEAQRFAEEKGLTFLLLGEGHKHAYFRVEAAATCTESGNISVACPCGETISSETVKPLGHSWSRRIAEKEDGSRIFEIYCTSCGTVQQSYPVDEEGNVLCDCRCHKINRSWSIQLTKDNWQEVFRNVIFRFKLAIWHLSGTHQYCACGARHF